MSTFIRICPLIVAALLQASAPQAGWTDLFNGKDFTGWKMWNADSFTIEDGAIVAHGTSGLAYYDGPVHNHAFRDFELKVDVMTRKGSNGGVFILTEYQEKGWPAKGFEVQVNNSYERDPVKTGSLYHVKDVNEAPAKDDEWFTQHVIVKGDTITINVNDKPTVEWKQPADWAGTGDFAGRRIAPGTIGLQAHDPNSTVYYKNIRIKPLD
jgi:hypothetical protein